MMRAVRFHGREDIRLDQIEIPVCGKGQVKVSKIRIKIKVEWCVSRGQNYNYL